MAGAAMGFMIATACASFSGSGHEACSKAVEAGAKQYGIERNLNMVESGLEREAIHKAHYYLGETTMGIAGSGVYVMKVVRDRSVHFNLPTFGICNRIRTDLGLDSSGMTFQWVLP